MKMMSLDNLRDMNAILLIPLIFLIIEAVLGYRRGLIKSVLLLISWILSIGVSALLVREFAKNTESVDKFAAIFEPLIGYTFSRMAALALVFVILLVMLKVVFHMLIKISGAISKVPVLGTTNKLLGALFGILKGGIIIFVAFLIYSIYNGSYTDLLWQEAPRLMELINQGIHYLQELWFQMQ